MFLTTWDTTKTIVLFNNNDYNSKIQKNMQNMYNQQMNFAKHWK